MLPFMKEGQVNSAVLIHMLAGPDCHVCCWHDVNKWGDERVVLLQPDANGDVVHCT